MYNMIIGIVSVNVSDVISHFFDSLLSGEKKNRNSKNGFSEVPTYDTYPWNNIKVVVYEIFGAHTYINLRNRVNNKRKKNIAKPI